MWSFLHQLETHSWIQNLDGTQSLWCVWSLLSLELENLANPLVHWSTSLPVK